MKIFMHFVLASFLSQPVSPFSLGINHSFAAPSAEVPDVSYHGSTGGSDERSSGNSLWYGASALRRCHLLPLYISLPVSVASGSVSVLGGVGV